MFAQNFNIDRFYHRRVYYGHLDEERNKFPLRFRLKKSAQHRRSDHHDLLFRQMIRELSSLCNLAGVQCRMVQSADSIMCVLIFLHSQCHRDAQICNIECLHNCVYQRQHFQCSHLAVFVALHTDMQLCRQAQYCLRKKSIVTVLIYPWFA